jgi:hypothetical protein
VELITSIPRNLQRWDLNGADVGADYFSRCVQSWKEHGFVIRTLNRRDELEVVRERFRLEPTEFSDDAESIFPGKFGPSFAEITKSLNPRSVVCITNADIYIIDTQNLTGRLEALSDKTFLFAHRTDVMSLSWPGPLYANYSRGADFVAFRPQHIMDVLQDPTFAKFKLGLYWWDYLLPIAASFFLPVTKIASPFVLHHVHGDKFDKDLYDAMLVRSFDVLARLSRKQRLLNPAAAIFATKIEGLDIAIQADRSAFAALCIDWMNGKMGAFDGTSFKLNLGHEALEGLLRTTLDELTTTREAVRKQSHIIDDLIERLRTLKRQTQMSKRRRSKVRRGNRTLSEQLAERWLALNHNWDLNVFRGSSSAMLGDKAAYRIKNFRPLLYQIRPKIDVLQVDMWSRFGNSVMQLFNAFYMAKRLGAQTVAFPRPHAFFAGDRAGELRLAWRASDLPYSRPCLVGNFFQLKAFRRSPTPGETARMFLELIRPLVVDQIREPDPRIKDDDLVLHFRSGDAFAGPVVPRNHGQPPLSYYLSAVEREQPARVWLVFEDRANPCIGATEAALQSRGVPILAQSSTLADDLRVLLSARRIVAGRGTFIHMIAHLSERLQKLYIFEHGAHRMQSLRELGVEVILVKDSGHEYKARLLNGNWTGSPVQRSLMLSYPPERLEFSAVKKSLGRPPWKTWIKRAYRMSSITGSA